MNWTCPYCDRDQYITDNRSVQHAPLSQKESRYQDVLLRITNITCANDACRKLSLSVELRQNKGHSQGQGYIAGTKYEEWTLLPDSIAKPQPDYIPKPLRDDYEEACKIRTLSAKSSATLARRCLQGMIRDFCNISKPRLIEEIKELRGRVDAGNAPAGVMADSIDAIDHVRGIGNIGAHMEKDINVIVEIDPNEAAILIGLVELLFREWYVARYQRQQRLAELKKLAKDKATQKSPPSGAS